MQFYTFAVQFPYNIYIFPRSNDKLLDISYSLVIFVEINLIYILIEQLEHEFL